MTAPHRTVAETATLARVNVGCGAGDASDVDRGRLVFQVEVSW